MTRTLALLLAAKGSGGSAGDDPFEAMGRFFMAIVLALVVIAVLLSAGYLLRKRLFDGGEEDDTTAGGFSMGQLRQLVKEGRMSQEEFDAAKAQIVAAMQRAADRKKPPKGPISETKLEEPK